MVVSWRVWSHWNWRSEGWLLPVIRWVLNGVMMYCSVVPMLEKKIWLCFRLPIRWVEPTSVWSRLKFRTNNSLTCPADVVVECTTPLMSTIWVLLFGYPIVGGGGCADVDDVDENVVDQINNCRVGNLIRNFTLTHNNQLVVAVKLKFVPDRPFTSNMIKWPKDTTFINSFCTAFDLILKICPQVMEHQYWWRRCFVIWLPKQSWRW